MEVTSASELREDEPLIAARPQQNEVSVRPHSRVESFELAMEQRVP